MEGAGEWVVDCSAFMPLVLADEDAGGIEQLILDAVAGSVHVRVPALFWYEVGNVLRMAVVRGRLTEDEAAGSLFRFAGLPITTDADLTPAILLRIERFAAEHRLTAYDAAYVELADRHSAQLLSCDRHLLALRPGLSWIVDGRKRESGKGGKTESF